VSSSLLVAASPLPLTVSRTLPPVMLFPGCPSVKGTNTTGSRRAGPARETRVGTPGVAAPVRGRQDWDGDRHPGPAASYGGRARYRSRPPRGEAGWTWPRVPCNQRRCVPEGFPGAVAQLVRSFHLQSSVSPGQRVRCAWRAVPLRVRSGVRLLGFRSLGWRLLRHRCPRCGVILRGVGPDVDPPAGEPGG